MTFDLNFADENDFHCVPYITEQRHTVVAFKEPLSPKYRIDANLEHLKNIVQSHFLIRLFLMKKKGKKISICLSFEDGKDVERITTEALPKLSERTFTIPPCKDSFKLYSGFISSCTKNSETMFYCANERTVCPIKSANRLVKNLPEDQSMLLLLCGQCLDDAVNDARNDFNFPMSQDNQQSLFPSLSLKQIEDKILLEAQEIVRDKFPELKDLNQKAIDSAIEEAPYLARYIRKDENVIKEKDALIKRAKRAFDREKDDAKRRFEALLTEKNIDTEEFIKSVGAISDVAKDELGEYILYRQAIIDALSKVKEDPEKKEKFLHNIFMPMKTSSFGTDDSLVARSNLWLLDDKFMTYTYAASDKTFRAIQNAIDNNENITHPLGRPDLCIFFDRAEHNLDKSSDVIVVELKGANASKKEKLSALRELPDNIGIIRKNIPSARRIWGYIITSLDDISESLSNSDYLPLFTEEKQKIGFYIYLRTNDAYITVLDVSTIASDADARNRTFLNILKGNPNPVS